MVLSEFRKYLNPVQVIDLADRNPAAALQWAVLLAPKVLKVLVGGGDGTVAWILTTIHKLDLDVKNKHYALIIIYRIIFVAGTFDSYFTLRNWKRLIPNFRLGKAKSKRNRSEHHTTKHQERETHQT